VSERPLAGRRVLVTRAEDQAQPLLAALRAAGADAVHVPLIRHEVLVDAAAVRAARERLAAHRGDRWLAVTSATTVSVIASSLAAAGGLPEATRVLAVGPATAAAARELFDRPSTAVLLADDPCASFRSHRPARSHTSTTTGRTIGLRRRRL